MTADRAISRRAWIGSVAAAMLAGCGPRGCRPEPPPADADAAGQLDIQEIDFEPGPVGPQKAVVIAPRWGAAHEKYPLLVALHGRGESNHGLSIGAWGWVKDYWLDRTILRVRRPPLDRAALLGHTDDAQLGRLNGTLAAKPFRGLVIACPYTTDILGSGGLDAAEPFAAFLEQQLLPKVRASFPVRADRLSTGIDGVSLGGRMALLAAFARPKLFGAIGTLQAAVRTAEPKAFAERARQALDQAGKPWPLRLLTSDGDPFRPTLAKLAEELKAREVDASYEVVAGPHDYAFNRGPGAYEMLLWHDRVLRGEAPFVTTG